MTAVMFAGYISLIAINGFFAGLNFATLLDDHQLCRGLRVKPLAGFCCGILAVVCFALVLYYRGRQ